MFNRILIIVLFLFQYHSFSLFAQQGLINRVNQLERNVVKIQVVSGSGPLNGFGFIVGQKDSLFYIATAYHTLEGISANDQNSIRVYPKNKQSYPATLLYASDDWDASDDLALLTVKLPINYFWQKGCASYIQPVNQEQASFVAWEGSWEKFGVEHGGGFVKTIETDIIYFRHPSVEPGVSGSPLITENGIIGMVIEDERSGSSALSINRIKALIEKKNLNVYHLEPLKSRASMVYIPKTETFRPGSKSGGKDAQPPKYPVKISAFYLDKYELTVKEYKDYLNDTGSKSQTPKNLTDDHPICNITWWDAIRYCNWVSIHEHYQEYYTINPKNNTVTINSGSNGYRLPTELEWEYAARGNDSMTPSSNSTTPKSNKSRIVAEGKSNAFNLINMMGNVAEWCWDDYSKTIYASIVPSNANDPQSSNREEEGARKIARGSTYENKSIRVYTRSNYPPNSGYPYIGFRLARNAN